MRGNIVMEVRVVGDGRRGWVENENEDEEEEEEEKEKVRTIVWDFFRLKGNFLEIF